MFSTKQRRLILLISLILFIGSAVLVFRTYFQPANISFETTGIPSVATPDSIPQTTEPGAFENQTQDNFILVHLAGAIKNPGIYKVKPGTRVLDLVKNSGGFSDGVDLDKTNLASKLKDGQKIEFRFRKISKKETADPYTKKHFNPNEKIPLGKIDINQASREDLLNLPGIGPKRAEAIYVFRQQKGRINNLDELLSVKGIGPKKLKILKEYLK